MRGMQGSGVLLFFCEEIDMAMNPMQRKANNYLLMGVLGTLLVTGAIIAFLFFKLNTLQQDNKKREAAMQKVIVAVDDIKAGTNAVAPGSPITFKLFLITSSTTLYPGSLIIGLP